MAGKILQRKKIKSQTWSFLSATKFILWALIDYCHIPKTVKPGVIFRTSLNNWADLRKLPPSKYMFVKYSWIIAMRCSRNIRKKFPMKFWGMFPNNVPGMLNIGIFPECSMNILWMLHGFFLGRSTNAIVLFSSG